MEQSVSKNPNGEQLKHHKVTLKTRNKINGGSSFEIRRIKIRLRESEENQ